MAKVRQVNTFFWDDSYIETLKPNEKLLFIYLITTPLTNIAGSFEISLKKICDHTDLSRSKVEEILQKFEADGKFIYRENWMLAVNAIGHQDFNNPKIAKGIEIIISDSPRWAIDRVCIAYKWLSDRLSHLNPNPNLNSNPNSNGSPPSANGSGGHTPARRKLPAKTEAEVNTWLDAIAPLVGAKSRKTIANLKQWREAVEKAIAEDRSITDFLAVVKSEAQRNKASPQFFTPSSVLKIVQAQSTKSSKFFH